jgi:CBS domain-containing protein
MTTNAHKQVDPTQDPADRRRFTRAILADLHALERMLREERFETGVRRIGAEQELFLVDGDWSPKGGAIPLLDKLSDPHFTTELGRFQLEANCDPQLFGGDGLSRLEAQLEALIEKTRLAAAELGMHPVLTGILPTMRKSDLGMDNMVDNPRYLALSKAMAQLRGGAFEFSIKGLDELIIKHDSVMLEACNSSFQFHLQVEPAEFARMYNIAQLLAGPVMAISANSPLLFGRRLWSETRIALFKQSVDTRTHTHHLRQSEARVSFGTKWIKSSVLEIFREDIARFRTLVGGVLDEDPMARLDRGEAPALKALRLHNSTIYRWNRACYGVVDGRAHLRIENRVMPAGPSIRDEVANGAFWVGLMAELGAQDDDITRRIDFDQAGANFYSAAMEGLGAHFVWLDGERTPADRLVLDKLLPLAESGLRRQGVLDADIRRYLETVESRVRTGRTGARWQLDSWNALKDKATAGERSNAIVAAMVQRQATGRPVAEWERARLDESDVSARNYQRVDQYMATDLVTVHAEDPAEIVTNLMIWERVRHIPVEDHEHRLVGLVTYRAILNLLASGRSPQDTPVADIMKTNVTTIGPETSSLEAVQLLRRLRIGCLPVVQDGRLVGIVTEEHFMKMSSRLLEAALSK